MPLYALGDRKPVCHADTWVAETATLIGSVVLEAEASVFFGAVIRGNVIVGHQAMLHGCSVGDGSLIGIGAIILNGAVIGKHCLVGAGAVVPEGKIYPDRSLILGTPAKVVRTLSDEEVQAQLDGAALYVARWRQYAAELKPLAPNP